MLHLKHSGSIHYMSQYCTITSDFNQKTTEDFTYYQYSPFQACTAVKY